MKARMLITAASDGSGRVSIRALDGGSPRDALTEAGFEPGDVVEVTLCEDELPAQVLDVIHNPSRWHVFGDAVN